MGHLDEIRVLQDGDVGGDGGRHPFDVRFPERPHHAVPGFFPVPAPDDHLGDQVVVELADGVALFVTGIGAHPEAVRTAEGRDGPGRGEKAAARGILGVDAHLDGVAVEVHFVLGEPQRLASGDAQLEGHQVHADDGLRGGMLDLQPGVHLQKEEVAVLVDELHGAGVDVAAGPGDLDRRLAHGGQGSGRQYSAPGPPR